jgi:hypothetical protein
MACSWRSQQEIHESGGLAAQRACECCPGDTTRVIRFPTMCACGIPLPMGEGAPSDKILNVLRPYAANWSGTLGSGDMVIPKGDLPKLVDAIVTAVREAERATAEATDLEIFEVLQQANRSPSIQHQVTTLRRAFRIVRR